MPYQFLDLYEIFVNQIAGTELIFMVLSIIIILLFSIKFKFDNQTLFMVLAIWIIIMAYFISILLAITLAVIGFFIGSQINRLLTR